MNKAALGQKTHFMQFCKNVLNIKHSTHSSERKQETITTNQFVFSKCKFMLTIFLF